MSRVGQGRLARRSCVQLLLVLLLVTAMTPMTPTTSAAAVGEIPSATTVEERRSSADPPVLAYYYIWFNTTSWGRAKVDYPVIGRYSSDERRVMRQHIIWAKAAGITGFLVSWKSTPQLDERLEKLVEVAAEEDFHLGIVYQGLDFNRDPLPAPRVRQDLEGLADTYGTHPVFQVLAQPLVVLAGSWRFSAEEVALIGAPVRGRLRLLASEKDVGGVARLSGRVDGNAYYWSSAQSSEPSVAKRLAAMGEAVHADGGLWLAPVAPGYDARALGGHRVVERDGSEQLRHSWNAAITSNPDVVGVISWNEFSENTHVEPSRQNDFTALHALADIQGAPAPEVLSFDSSDPPGKAGGGRALATLVAMVGLVAGSLAVVSRRGLQDSRRLRDFLTQGGSDPRPRG